MHYYFLENKDFKEARKSSKNLIKKNLLKDTAKLLGMQILLLVLFFIFIIVGIILILTFNKLLSWITILESLLITIIVIFLIMTLIVFSILGTTFVYSFISVLFYKHKEEKNEEIIHINVKEVDKTLAKSKWKIIKYSFITLGIIGLSIFTNGVINNKYNLNIEYIKNMEITAHRGASAMYPENTMSAFIGAKELGADWIELDVQQTKDKQIIVSHDTNFKRVAGVNLNSWEANYDEIKELDVGSFKEEKFKGEKVPLLEDVIRWAIQNHIKLNIELKPTGFEKDFEKQVVEIIKNNNFENNCVITSQIYEVLENVKNIDNNVITVYVMSLAFGNITELDKADYFSVEATSITKSMVNQIHNAGKQIYGWTVNTEEGVNKMIDLNVDNIITDDIELGKRLVLESRNSDLITEIIKFIGSLI